MYHKLRVRLAGDHQYEDVAIDDINIDIVKPGGTGKSLAFDIDGAFCCEIGMDYDELVAKLNGEEWDAKQSPDTKQPPDPVVVSQWVWVDRCGEFSVCEGEEEAVFFTARLGGHAVELKGEYTP